MAQAEVELCTRKVHSIEINYCTSFLIYRFVFIPSGKRGFTFVFDSYNWLYKVEGLH